MPHRFRAARSLLIAAILAALPGAAAAQSGGTIEGQVELSPRAARRVASSYPGAAGGTHVVGSVPPVAFLVGRIAGAPPASPQRARLAQQDTSFRPALLVVPTGARVEFPNGDPFFHNVFSYSPVKRFDLGRYPRGESRTVTFDRPGVAKVYCEIHQWMRAAVVVVENPFHAVVGADGRFRIAGVPAGRYRLTVWDVDRGERTVDVVVPASGTARVRLRL
ncbi:carboxypeptidase regulatory-like domain-containing protein [Longimicrobium sp.]|jgi:plastocyanin|uniref:carboxypeptidase regulatory-like domain-containing protein n=1 Tax=Longimicrobium sp. TaxID=2029185 RepID=UPI002F9403E4